LRKCALENDPLAFVSTDATHVFVDELGLAWRRFARDLPSLAVPTLALHGNSDSVVPVDVIRRAAAQSPAIRLREFDGARHDLLNETVHRQVADAVVGFVKAL